MNALIKVAASEKVLSNPELYAGSSGAGCVVAVDRTVLVLDSICQSLQLCIQFEAEVDVVGLCQEGQFLVAGERSGNLHLIHVSSKQTLLTNKLVQRSSDGRTYMKLILEKDSSDGGIYHAFILTNNGFFCVMHLPLAKTQEAIHKMDIDTAKKGLGDCVLSVWEVNPSKKWIAIQNVAESSTITAAKRLQVVDSLLFVLDNEASLLGLYSFCNLILQINVLSLWDVYSLTLIWNCPTVDIEEFLLTSESDSSAVSRQGIASLKLVALTKPENNKQMRNIVVFSLPAMHQLYSLEVTNTSSLVQSGINTDTIYFLEGMFENNQKSSDVPISFLVMRCLTEALPENRLSRLLHKHKFTEAENFAVQFGLEIELVYKVKVSSILEKLVTESTAGGGQAAWLDLVAQAKETLNKIKDNQFVLEYCINMPWPTYETAQEMLYYARSRVLKRDATTVVPLLAGDPAALSEVLRAQAKLTTFYGAFGLEKYRLTLFLLISFVEAIFSSGTAWIEFLNNQNIFKEILSQLKEGNLSCAQYLWLRHQADFKSDFSMDMLDDLLSTVRTAVSRKELCRWFKDVVIPFVRQVIPHGQRKIAKWLEQGARNLELTDKANWPENGLEMAQVFFNSKAPGEIGLASSCHWVPFKDSDEEEVCSVKGLVSALQGLVDLYRKYNCRLALCDFEKQNANAIVFRMLDKVLAAELIPATLEKYIEPYMCHRNLEKDEILLQYIKDLLQRYCTRSTSVLDTTWEAKAIAVLGCMSNIDMVLEGVLEIMHGAVVPWSPGVEQLVQQYLGTDHEKVALLHEGYRLMEMKTLLRSYGVRDTNLLNDKQMILMLVKYILKQEKPSSLEDALKLVNAYMLPSAEVYLWWIVDLIHKGKGEEVVTLLKSLPAAEALEVAEKMLIWGRLVLETQLDDHEEEQQQQQQQQLHLNVKNILVETLKFLLSHHKENPLKKEEYGADLKLFKALTALQENFNICISVKDYWNPSLMSQLLEENIEIYERTGRARKMEAGDACLEESSVRRPLTRLRLYRLALLLRRTEHAMASALVLRAFENGRVEEALEICRYFYEYYHNEQTGELLFLACQKLCHMLCSDSLMVIPEGLNLPAVIKEMACQAAVLCNPDLSLDVLELCKYALFAHEIYGKCQIEDYGFTSKTASLGADKDPYLEWTFDNFFTEDGAVLDFPAVLPFAYEIMSLNFPPAGRERHPLDSASLAHRPFEQGKSLSFSCRNPTSALLSRLQECSQYELALGLTISSFRSFFQHVISNNMDIGLGEKLHDRETQDGTRAVLVTALQGSASEVRGIVTTLLHKIFNSHQIDLNLALGYCTLLPKEIIFEKLWDIINKTPQNYTKILAAGLVGTQLASQYEETKEKEAFEELITDAEWGIQLGKLGISFQNLFRMPSARKKELLKTLAQHPDVTTELILKYCRTFLLDTDAALQLYIKTHVQNTGAACAEGGPAGDAGKQQRRACAAARAAETLPLLSSTSGLVASLSAMLHKLDPYDYETIESLLTIIEKAGGRAKGLPLNWALMLLKHLKSYKRISAPGDLEHRYVFEQAIPLSPAAQTRLPFHLIFFQTSHCFWKIISAELSEETFPKLLLISKLMKVSLDTLYMSAANHVFQGKVKPKLLELTRSGRVLVPNKEMAKTMQAVQSYLLSIANPEWATALAHKIAQELPVGPTKVLALKICLGLAEKWLKNTAATEDAHEKAQAHLKNLQVQHRRSATEAVLTAHKLSSEEHRKLIGKPANLVILLYQHRSIADRAQDPSSRDHPDIHAAAREIAEINDLDMKKIWDMLLEKWLCPNTLPTDKTSDIFENVHEDEDFKRVLYLLQLHPVDYSLRILYECTVSAVSPIGVNQLTFAHRSRALRCLLCLADPRAVEALFKKPVKKVKHFLKCLIHLTVLENLNIPYTYESFHSAPKEGLIKGLWKNHSHEPTAVKLVTELSLEYSVYNAQLWNGLLQKLISFNMIPYLRKVLAEITGIYSLWQVPYFSRAWRTVILAPFLSASCPSNAGQSEACYESFNMLLMCPVLADLDLTAIARQYSKTGQTALALGCLLLMPQPEKRSEQIQGFLDLYQLDTVLQQVECMSLCEAAGFASQIRSLILDYIMNKKYEEFANPKYFPLLNLPEMGPDRMKGLVEKLVNKNRMDDAAHLITEYLNKSGNFLPPEKSSSGVVKVVKCVLY
ncbi:Kinetochore-associated protein 1 [Varanus komodoensis]|nr:Kinetochore-associated protein 1 [Varanus komodoensis]